VRFRYSHKGEKKLYRKPRFWVGEILFETAPPPAGPSRLKKKVKGGFWGNF